MENYTSLPSAIEIRLTLIWKIYVLKDDSIADNYMKYRTKINGDNIFLKTVATATIVDRYGPPPGDFLINNFNQNIMHFQNVTDILLNTDDFNYLFDKLKHPSEKWNFMWRAMS